MENFSQEKKIEEQNLEPNNNADIQFEEFLNIDEIQQKLQEKIYENDSIPDLSEKLELIEIRQRLPINETDSEKEEHEKTSIDALNPSVEIDIHSKKYVIYIDSNNVDFMENLSINDRRLIINKILKEEHALSVKTKEINRRKRFLTHLILACLTFIIGFPIMFIVVNKAMETTILNYREAKQNVTRLYKQNGKIKMSESGVDTNIKY